MQNARKVNKVVNDNREHFLEPKRCLIESMKYLHEEDLKQVSMKVKIVVRKE